MYIAALSANVLESAEELDAMGLDAFLSKPLRPDAIAQLWQMACARAAATP
jgi:CheY-like chemotaxis protein